ncbi:ligand-binding sensor domain-containing protein [Fibrella forsythiae]|uniref:Histidine kinase n=1 Tax=Fibrella forsythiae TaxID=2817061 RepID=A0ABS3JEM6_9BACT|nr:two-component regulator propeller domain-containing protein [Fibrella forsythiae]MBO0948456.1 hypothetical protein [Fibrella forsythiae]
MFVAVTACNEQPTSTPSKSGALLPSTTPVNWVGDPSKAFIQSQVSEYIRRMFQDKDGNIRFGRQGDGACRYDGKTLTYFTPKEGFSGEVVGGIEQLAAGTIWFATNDGDGRYDGKTFRTFTVKDGLSDNDIWSMLKDSKGNLWFGTLGGVSRYDGKTFISFPLPKASIAANPRFSPKLVWSFCEDRVGNIWFGLDGDGVRKYDGNSFTNYSIAEGLGNRFVQSILEDKRGELWFGTSGGVYRFNGKTFTNFTKKEANQ